MVDLVIETYQLKRAISSTWSKENPILQDGEMALEKDTWRLKVGNGIDRWNDLPYISLSPENPPRINSKETYIPERVLWREEFARYQSKVAEIAVLLFIVIMIIFGLVIYFHT